MKVFVASVYKPGSWDLYKAQRWFLDQTTADYRQLIVSSKIPPFECEYLLADQGQREGGQRHLAGLLAARDWFRVHAADFDLGLILDSDAFPVRKGWDRDIARLLKKTRCQFAAPVRAENLDAFPHISFLAFLPAALGLVAAHLRRDRRGLTLFRRQSRRDTAASLPMRQCFPLIKSNVYSPHPTMHSIYGDMAYHAAATGHGGRMRSLRRYWPLVTDLARFEQFETVPASPAWINRLLGEPRFSETDFPLPS
ncbi:MAG: hypothetical protein ABSG68_25960 [Thermoguttaceae bacterium]|jgi:hypothetical protein